MTSCNGQFTVVETKTLIWDVDHLWELAADLIPFEKLVHSFKEWNEWVWEADMTMEDLVDHIQRVLVADMTKPIILSQDGWIMDGAHRLVRARIEGYDTVSTVQFEVDPEPDHIKDEGTS